MLMSCLCHVSVMFVAFQGAGSIPVVSLLALAPAPGLQRSCRDPAIRRGVDRCRIAQGVLLLPCVLALAGFHAWLTCTGRRGSAVIFLSSSCHLPVMFMLFVPNSAKVDHSARMIQIY